MAIQLVAGAARAGGPAAFDGLDLIFVPAPDKGAREVAPAARAHFDGFGFGFGLDCVCGGSCPPPERIAMSLSFLR